MKNFSYFKNGQGEIYGVHPRVIKNGFILKEDHVPLTEEEKKNFLSKSIGNIEDSSPTEEMVPVPEPVAEPLVKRVIRKVIPIRKATKQVEKSSNVEPESIPQPVQETREELIQRLREEALNPILEEKGEM